MQNNFPYLEKFSQEFLNENKKNYEIQKKSKKEKDIFSNGLNIQILYKDAAQYFSRNLKCPENILVQFLCYFSIIQQQESIILACSTLDIYSKSLETLLTNTKIYDFNKQFPLNIYNIDISLLNLITIIIFTGQRWLCTFLNYKTKKGQIIDFGVNDKLKSQSNKIGIFVQNFLNNNFKLNIETIDWEFYTELLDKKTDCSYWIMTFIQKYLLTSTDKLNNNKLVEITNLQLSKEQVYENLNLLDWVFLELQKDAQLNQLQNIQQIKIRNLEKIKQTEENLILTQKRNEEKKIQLEQQRKRQEKIDAEQKAKAQRYNNYKEKIVLNLKEQGKLDSFTTRIPNPYAHNDPEIAELKFLSNQFNEKLKFMIQQQQQMVQIIKDQQDMQIRLNKNEQIIQNLQNQVDQNRFRANLNDFLLLDKSNTLLLEKVEIKQQQQENIKQLDKQKYQNFRQQLNNKYNLQENDNQVSLPFINSLNSRSAVFNYKTEEPYDKYQFFNNIPSYEYANHQTPQINVQNRKYNY